MNITPCIHKSLSIPSKKSISLFLYRFSFRRILNNYLVWQTVRSLTACLSKPFREAYKGLRKALLGSEGHEEQWRYCVSDVNNAMGFAIGAMFVREVFHGKSKPMVSLHISVSILEKISYLFTIIYNYFSWATFHSYKSKWKITFCRFKAGPIMSWKFSRTELIFQIPFKYMWIQLIFRYWSYHLNKSTKDASSDL